MLSAIGLMSGTSMDGIDLAFVETDGEGAIRLGPTLAVDYREEERDLLRRALAEARRLSDRRSRAGVLGEAEAMLTRRHAETVEAFLAREGLEPSAVDVIGFHGQTVLHRPEHRLTVQIGDGPALADRLGIPVIHDLRAADVAAGGQGAPFVPVFHRALVEASALEGPVAVLNLGGVGNVSFVDRGRDPIAFDTGPGNALLDDLMRERTGEAMDLGGETALSGRCDEAVLAQLLAHPYFDRLPPKSLDRDDFSADRVDGLDTADAAATLAAFTAASAAGARRFLPAEPAHWIVCGGGARNSAILAELGRRVPGRVMTAEEAGWSSAMMEAQAFAYLAVRSLRHLPLSFPSTTGVPRPMVGGVLARPAGMVVPA
jgi:anhydro-N-acetylmuramic acid kinase